MIVSVDIPEITKYRDGFPSHWANIIFLGNRPKTWKIRAIVTTYVRLVEGALFNYEIARQQVVRLWRTHAEIAIGSHNLSGTLFEDCINCMHRAALCMVRIRGNHESPDDLKSLFFSKPQFTKDIITNRLRIIRDTIQHMEEKVLRGDIPEATPFMLTATGIETTVHDSKHPKQTVKVIDRLVIGVEEVRFSELAGWLTEMGECAEKISKYQPAD